MLVLIFCLLIIFIIVCLFWQLFVRPLPKVKGEIRLPGLHCPVEVWRDPWGVPHIRAENEQDLFLAQGYVHAQDRFWQMEFTRRFSSGLMSEIFGARLLEWDSFYRRLGLRRAAKAELHNLSSESRSAYEAYAAGVNQFIATHRRRLPPEIQILRFGPRPWTPLDSLTWNKMLDWLMSANAESELIRDRLSQLLGESLAAELEPGYRADHPIHTPGGNLREELDGMPLAGGSNAWVVDGSHSATGKPLLASDPHTRLTTPGLWHQMHLTCDTLDAIGATIPGVPGVIVGHNRDIAWGVTVSFVDAQDVFLEKRNAENSKQFAFQGKWETAQTVEEFIPVRGHEQPVRLETLVTRHGPLMTESFQGETEPFAIQAVLHDPGDQMLAILRLNRARNLEEFHEAMRAWTGVSLNFVYADREGNIAYRLSGRVPIRRRCSTRLPKEGWSGEGEWQGYVPFEAMPQVVNPPCGCLISANHRIVDDRYPYDLGDDFANGYRAQRIEDLLKSSTKLSIEDFRRMHHDTHSLPGIELAAYFTNVTSSNARVQQAVDCLRTWEGDLSAETVAGTLYEVVQLHLIDTIFGAHLRHLNETYRGRGVTTFGGLNPIGGRNILPLRRVLGDPESFWWTDPATGNRRAREEVLLRCVEESIEELTHRLGPSMEEWRWGRLHQAAFPHSFQRVKFLRPIFCPKPVPLGGDKDTLAQASFSPTEPYGVSVSGVSYRQIIDLADWDNSLSICVPGQSGHRFSRHYLDLLKLWRSKEYHPMLFDWKLIERATRNRLTLLPSPRRAGSGCA